MSVQLTIGTRAATCTDPQWLCWIEAHPALAGWLQVVGVLATILIALFSPWWTEIIVQGRLRKHAATRAANAMARAVGTADAFVRGVEAWGGDAAFDRAFPQTMFETALNDLRLAEADLPHLGQAGPPVATFAMSFEGFIQLTQSLGAARERGELAEYVRFMEQRSQELAAKRSAILKQLKIKVEE